MIATGSKVTFEDTRTTGHVAEVQADGLALVYWNNGATSVMSVEHLREVEAR